VAVQTNTAVHAADLRLTHEPVAADQHAAGAPTTAVTALGEVDGRELGVWEMSEGGMRDVEVDELFVVLSGAATVEFADGSPTLRLGPGDVVRLAAGSETLWTVTDTLRKVYLA
jgi:uncharacterized protein